MTRARRAGAAIAPALSLAMAATLTVALAGCADTPEPSVGVDAGQAVIDTRSLVEEDLADLVAEVEEEHDGIAGVAVSFREGEAAAGIPGDSSAWSTLKVPIAIAAAQHGMASESQINAAVSTSDNAAATQLWNSLGSELEAAHAVELVMWRAGGPGNVRHAVTHYAGGPFGNSVWKLEPQARFATQLPCIEDADEVYDAMGEIAEWQEDGIGKVRGARFKGGWSAEKIEGGTYTYTYRQFGSVPAGEGIIGLAVIAHPADGSHETATDMLGELATGVEELVESGVIEPAEECSAR
ncbi:hypothetical protein [Corynebacterium doosanense]|nr:hypothetical protein [Corynebacterium doosanense]